MTHADHLRPGDVVTTASGTVVTLEELPWLTATGLIRSKGRTSERAPRIVTVIWPDRDALPLIAEDAR